MEMWTRAGCHYYCAPEIFSATGYTEKVDTWSVGVILFQLLTGSLPFHEHTICDTIESILSKPVELRSIPMQVRDLLTRLLEKDPLKRLSAEQAIAHPWFFVITSMTKPL
jgi:calcium-dependent protein kinase